MMFYRQCKLCRILLPREGEKHSRAVFELSWVPAEFAKKGSAVTIDGQEGAWTVTKVYAGKMTAEQVSAAGGKGPVGT